MVDFAAARRAMVDGQVLTGGVHEHRLLGVMGRIPREIFVPTARRELAYIDDLHGFGVSGRFLASPAVFARLANLAALTEDDTVLDVGATTGYSTAVLASLARHVVGLETEPTLAAQARDNLTSLGIANAEIVTEEAALTGRRFDVILLEGSVKAPPSNLLNLLGPRGRLIAVIADGGVGTARVFRQREGSLKAESYFNVSLPALYAAPSAEVFVF